MTYDLTCLSGTVNPLSVLACINTNSNGLLGGLLCVAIYVLLLLSASQTEYFANVLLSTSFAFTVVSGLLWALVNLQWWIVVLNFAIFVLAIIYKIWWRNE
jgi:hypothetical protein